MWESSESIKPIPMTSSSTTSSSQVGVTLVTVDGIRCFIAIDTPTERFALWKESDGTLYSVLPPHSPREIISITASNNSAHVTMISKQRIVTYIPSWNASTTNQFSSPKSINEAEDLRNWHEIYSLQLGHPIILRTVSYSHPLLFIQSIEEAFVVNVKFNLYHTCELVSPTFGWKSSSNLNMKSSLSDGVASDSSSSASASASVSSNSYDLATQCNSLSPDGRFLSILDQRSSTDRRHVLRIFCLDPLLHPPLLASTLDPSSTTPSASSSYSGFNETVSSGTSSTSSSEVCLSTTLDLQPLEEIGEFLRSDDNDGYNVNICEKLSCACWRAKSQFYSMDLLSVVWNDGRISIFEVHTQQDDDGDAIMAIALAAAVSAGVVQPQDTRKHAAGLSNVGKTTGVTTGSSGLVHRPELRLLKEFRCDQWLESPFLTVDGDINEDDDVGLSVSDSSAANVLSSSNNSNGLFIHLPSSQNVCVPSRSVIAPINHVTFQWLYGHQSYFSYHDDEKATVSNNMTAAKGETFGRKAHVSPKFRVNEVQEVGCWMSVVLWQGDVPMTSTKTGTKETSRIRGHLCFPCLIHESEMDIYRVDSSQLIQLQLHSPTSTLTNSLNTACFLPQEVQIAAVNGAFHPQVRASPTAVNVSLVIGRSAVTELSFGCSSSEEWAMDIRLTQQSTFLWPQEPSTQSRIRQESLVLKSPLIPSGLSSLIAVLPEYCKELGQMRVSDFLRIGVMRSNTGTTEYACFLSTNSETTNNSITEGVKLVLARSTLHSMQDEEEAKFHSSLCGGLDVFSTNTHSWISHFNPKRTSGNVKSSSDYTVVVVPDQKYGLGIKIDATAAGEAIRVSSFKTHPVTGTAMCLQLSGRVNIGDELVSIGNRTLAGRAVSDAISEIRQVLNELKPNDSIQLTFSRPQVREEFTEMIQGNNIADFRNCHVSLFTPWKSWLSVSLPDCDGVVLASTIAVSLIDGYDHVHNAVELLSCDNHLTEPSKGIIDIFAAVLYSVGGNMLLRLYTIHLDPSKGDLTPVIRLEDTIPLCDKLGLLFQDGHQLRLIQYATESPGFLEVFCAADASFVVQFVYCIDSRRWVGRPRINCASATLTSDGHSTSRRLEGLLLPLPLATHLKAVAHIRSNLLARSAQLPNSPLRSPANGDAVSPFPASATAFHNTEQYGDSADSLRLLTALFSCGFHGAPLASLLGQIVQFCPPVSSLNQNSGRVFGNNSSRGKDLDNENDSFARENRYALTTSSLRIRLRAKMEAAALRMFSTESSETTKRNQHYDSTLSTAIFGDWVGSREAVTALYILFHSLTTLFAAVLPTESASIVGSSKNASSLSELSLILSVLQNSFGTSSSTTSTNLDSEGIRAIWIVLCRHAFEELALTSLDLLRYHRPALFPRTIIVAPEEVHSASSLMTEKKTTLLGSSENDSEAQPSKKDEVHLQSLPLPAAAVASLFFSRNQEDALYFLAAGFDGMGTTVGGNSGGDEILSKPRRLYRQLGLIVQQVPLPMTSDGANEGSSLPTGTISGSEISFLDHATLLRVSFWLHDLSLFRESLHKQSLRRFATNRRVFDVFLELVVAGRPDVLLTLVRADPSPAGKQMAALLKVVSNAFAASESERQAAANGELSDSDEDSSEENNSSDESNDQADFKNKFSALGSGVLTPKALESLSRSLRKNAFALVRLQRFRDAAGVFLLCPTAANIRSAVSLLAIQGNAPFLAHLVARCLETTSFASPSGTPPPTSLPTAGNPVQLESLAKWLLSPSKRGRHAFVLGSYSAELLIRDILPNLLSAAGVSSGKSAPQLGSQFDGNLQGYDAALLALVGSVWTQDEQVIRDTFTSVEPVIRNALTNLSIPDKLPTNSSNHEAWFTSIIPDSSFESPLNSRIIHHVYEHLEASLGPLSSLFTFINLSASLTALRHLTKYFGKRRGSKLLKIIESFLALNELHTEVSLFFGDLSLRKKSETKVHAPKSRSSIWASAAEKVLFSEPDEDDAFLHYCKEFQTRANKIRDEERVIQAAAEAAHARALASAVSLKEARQSTASQQHTPPKTPISNFNFAQHRKPLMTTTTQSNNMLDDFDPPARRPAATNAAPPRSMLDDFDPPARRPAATNAAPPRSMLDDFDPPARRPAATNAAPPRSMLDDFDPPARRPAATNAAPPRSMLDDFDPPARRPAATNAAPPRSMLDDFDPPARRPAATNAAPPRSMLDDFDPPARRPTSSNTSSQIL